MNRHLSSVQTAPIVSVPVGQTTPVATVRPLAQANEAQATAPVRNDLYRGSYVGKSYLRRSRRSTAGSQSMFRIS
ncbi:hypothetical protein [Novilysobacter antarcticus]|uniref:hypothetical protein n=1 Tax=Novilysobacter antarcticus TaxID=2862543 RepID=UPI001C99B5E2|nr:hypothetical protein [Lysobacter antarcticus]